MCILRQVPIEPRVRSPKDPDHNQGQKDEIGSEDRVGDERVECLIREIVRIVERVAALLSCRKASKEHQRCCVKQEDGFVCISGPAQAQHRGPSDPLEPAPPRQAIGIGRFDVAFGDGLQCAIEDFAGVGRGVQNQNDQRTPRRCGQRAEDGKDGFEFEEQEVGKEELDEEGRASEDENEPLGGFSGEAVRRSFSDSDSRGDHEPDQHGQYAEVDVPDHARADQCELLAQREVAARQQAFAIPYAAEGVVRDGLGATHAAAFRCASPAAVACPRVSRAMMRSNTTSETLVNKR